MPKVDTRHVRHALEKAVRQRFPGAKVQPKTFHVHTDPQEMPGVRNIQPDEATYWIYQPYSNSKENAGEQILAFLKEFAESQGGHFQTSMMDPR